MLLQFRHTVLSSVFVRYLRTLTVLIIAVLFCCIPVSARPSSVDIAVQATFGYNGYFKEGHPAPVTVRVSNSGEMLDGWALLDLESWVPDTYYTRPILIPPGGSIDLEFGGFGCDYGIGCEVPLEIYTADGNLLKTAVLQSCKLRTYDSILVHLGEPPSDLWSLFDGINPGFLSYLRFGYDRNPGGLEYQPRIYPIVLDPSALPGNAILMECISLITTDLKTYLDLEESTRNLLLEYARHGGNVLVYYREDREPNTEWQSDPILFVQPTGEHGYVDLKSLSDVARAIVPDDFVPVGVFTFLMTLERGRHGENYPHARFVNEDEVQVRERPRPMPDWNPPDQYAAVGTVPNVPCDEVYADEFSDPILVVRKIGSGHAAFAALNPFIGGPKALDPPVTILSVFGLLDPVNLVNWATEQTPKGFEQIEGDETIRTFFGRFQPRLHSPLLRYIEAVGISTLVYLLGIPFIALMARRRKGLLLSLYAVWALFMTGVTPSPDFVKINEANLYWCEALLPDEETEGASGATQIHTCLSYDASNPIPRTVSWDGTGSLLDELVPNDRSWPYGSVTIEEGPVTSLPDLPFEVDAFRANPRLPRVFSYRGFEPDMWASGRLEVDPESAHLTLNANLPFAAQTATLVVVSDRLQVVMSLESQDRVLAIDADLIEGTEIVRSPELFPGYTPQILPDGSPNLDRNIAGDLDHLLRTYRNFVLSTPVALSQVYTTSRTTGRPEKAFVVMTSRGMSVDISISRGELNRRALSIMVITVPIIYDEYEIE